MQKKRIAIFASGNGTNAMNLIHFFENSNDAEIVFVLANRSDAGVLTKAENAGIQTVVLSNQEIEAGVAVVRVCMEQAIDVIVLAGFLRKIPAELIRQYPNRIVNIHPALLPNYGGKGMYGEHVHQAVIAAGEKESGISIHLVDEEYDHGKTIFQAKLAILPQETPDTLAQRIHQLEHQHYPKVIERWVS